MSSANALAFVRLVKQILGQEDTDNPRRVGEADFLSRYAVKLAPQDAEVAKRRARIETQIIGPSK